MGRYNWITRTLWTLSVLACGGWAPTAATADFQDNNTSASYGWPCAAQPHAGGGAGAGSYAYNYVTDTWTGTDYAPDGTI